MPRPRLAFGTYRMKGETAARLVTGALEAGIRGIDTAQLYGNEAFVFQAVRAFEAAHAELGPVRVTTKVYKNLLFDQTVRAIEGSAERLGRALDVVLLHRPLPPVMWRALSACVDRGLTREIGVSNYSARHLQALLALCDGTQGGTPCRRPSVNQIEIHPFVGPIQALLSACTAEGIRVEGHTVLARGQFFDFAPLAKLSARLGVSPAVVMLRWAQTLGVDVVFHTTKEDHLRETLEAATGERPRLDVREMTEISGYYGMKTVRFFPVADVSPIHTELSELVDTADYVDAVAARLDEDRRALTAGMPVSNMALSLPASTNRQLLTDPVANRLALRVFPAEPGASEQASYDRFRELVRKLRAAAHAQREGQPKPKKTSCTIDPPRKAARFVKGEPVSMVVAYPEAMPVQVSPAQDFAPFFDFLRHPEALGAMPEEDKGPLVFKRGAFYGDARMDLCKQVVGPDHIGALCDAVAEPFTRESAPGRVRHFLLGNNIACEGASTAGAEALARLMANPRAEIETWYLAGNAIGPEDMAVIGRALEDNVHARALWLKRNPLGKEGAAPLGRLLAKNRTLRLLDVHTTGLFDEGVEALAQAFEGAGGELHLRHLYAGANALSETSLVALRPLLTKDLPRPSSLVSLSLALNRLRNRGCEVFAALVETGALAGLVRLDLGAIGLDRPDLSRLAGALITHCPKLRSLDLGTYLSTRDMGEAANRLDPDVTPLVRLLQEHPALELLDVALCGLPAASLARLVEALGPHQSLHGVGSHAFHHTERERRFLKHPRRVVHIDSIYRGRD